MDPMQIVLIGIIVAVIVLNIGFMATGKKKRKRETVKHASALALMVKNEKKLGGENNYSFARFISEGGDNYLVCKSNINSSKAIISEKNFYFINDGSSAMCDVIVQEEKGKILSIGCSVQAKALKKFSVVFTSKPHGANSEKAKMLIGIAEDFQAEVLK